MAIALKSQGAGVSTETSGAALSPLCPATVDAGDILIAHVFWEGTTTAPSTPGGWTLLGSSPYVIETTVARHWVFGRIADGTEDSGAVAFGSPAVTTQRAARIYSFSGRVSGAIDALVGGFSHQSHATDPQMPTVTTPAAGALAVALVAQNDNNAFASPTGESGGDWVEAVAEYTAALTPGLSLGLETCTPTANPGTVSGGSMATTNDPCGVIGFYIRDQAVATSSNAESGSYTITGVAATSARSVPSNAESGSYAITGSSANDGIGSGAGAGAYSIGGVEATAARSVPSHAEPGSYVLTGQAAVDGLGSSAGPGSYAIGGAAAEAKVAIPSNAEPGSYTITGADAQDVVSGAPVAHVSNAEPGSYSIVGAAAEAAIVAAPAGGSGGDGGGGWYFLLPPNRRRELTMLAVYFMDEDEF